MKTDVDVARVHDQNRRFHDEVEAEVYDQRMGISYDAEATARMIAELEEVLGKPLPGGTVVDVGSGTGHVAVKLAKSGRFSRVVATDISPRMLACARKNASLAGCTIETVETDMVHLPFEDASVDLVVGCAILHHLPDPVAFLPEVRRILKPGAPCIFIGDPSTWGSRISNVLKFPLLAVYRVYKLLTGRTPKTSWEHDHIDVHTFSRRDIDPLTRGFERVKVLPQGFLEPLLDIAFLTTVRERLGRIPGVAASVSGLRWVCGKLDLHFFNHVVPGDLCVSMKFSAFRPAGSATGIGPKVASSARDHS